MLLSDKRILEEKKKGNIVITPFDSTNLNTSSYDVTLGEYYYREHRPLAGHGVYSPWSEHEVCSVWGEPQKAVRAGKYANDVGFRLPEGIKASDLAIFLPPGETFLCHTKEYIGGRNGITTMMKARSSLGRNFIEVCKCAGWGDVGYINRWTMEITNNSKNYIIPLIVGRRVAQITFFEVGETIDSDYSNTGKYQSTTDLKSLKKNWTPESMLPKMWKDKEAK